MMLHAISHNCLKIHKMVPSAPPAPKPIEFLRFPNDSGGILHPEMHGIHRNMRDFMDFTYFHESLRKWRKFKISCEFRILEWRSPPEPLKYHRFPIGFAVGGAEGPMFMRIHEVMWIPHNSTEIINFGNFNRIHTVLPKWVPFRPRRSKILL